MIKLKKFLEDYFNAKFEEFKNALKSGEKEAFVEAFTSGFIFDPMITVNLNDEIVELLNRPRFMPQRLEQFLKEWLEEEK